MLASLTILYSLWEKKNETTKQEIEREMAMPLDILDEIGQTYGPTRKLHQALANLVAATIQNLERSRSGSANVQGVSFGSPTQNLIPPPMQLPMRIDASLHFERSTRENPTSLPISSEFARESHNERVDPTVGHPDRVVFKLHKAKQVSTRFGDNPSTP